MSAFFPPGMLRSSVSAGSARSLRRWVLEGSAARGLVAESSRLSARRQFDEAAAALLRAWEQAPYHAGLALAVSHLARYGSVSFERASDALRLALTHDLEPISRRRLRHALLELIWERVGADHEAAHLARKVSRHARLHSALSFRCAALLNASGAHDEAVETFERAARRAPRVAARVAYLNLCLTLEATGRHDLVHARAAREVAAALEAHGGRLSHLVGAARGRCAVVANGPSLVGAKRGRQIDGHDLVVRCNRYVEGADHAADYGSRTDVWFRPHTQARVPMRPVEAIKLLVVLGCDIPNRFSDGVVALASLRAHGPALELIPAEIYRRLFNLLGAAPSSGTLALAWTSQLAHGRLPPPRAFGFDLALNDAATSHYASGKSIGRTPSRHNWPAETRFVESLTRRGEERGEGSQG